MFYIDIIQDAARYRRLHRIYDVIGSVAVFQTASLSSSLSRCNMKYTVVEKRYNHPWTNDPEWLTEIWVLEDEKDIEALISLSKSEGFAIWMDGYKGENRTLVLYKQIKNAI